MKSKSIKSDFPVADTESERMMKMHAEFVMPTYGRFPLVFSHGKGTTLWDHEGNSYLDMGGGIAVNCLGHAHPELLQAVADQSARLGHISNLYYHEGQGLLAYEIVSRIAHGKVFFCNSGAEANDGLYKLARKWGAKDGRFEILTTHNSFHGRTLAGIAATGQEKVKTGFAPLPPGFRHVAFNDLEAMRSAISPATVAILIEGIQGEGGIVPASPDYLIGLRALCHEHNLLMMMDGIQCGHYRTGHFQSFQTFLDEETLKQGFMPDAISMAKSLGGGFPMGAFWACAQVADTLSPGSHGTTYGGGPLACHVALKILEIIDRDQLGQNAMARGHQLIQGLRQLQASFPDIIRDVRGTGLMLGLVLEETSPALNHEGKSPALTLVNHLHENGMLTIPAGQSVVRFLPALNITPETVDLALEKLEASLTLLKR